MAAGHTLPTAENLLTNQVTIGTGAGQIVPARGKRGAITIVNDGTVPIYIGNSSSVTTSSGFPIAAGAAVTLNYNGPIWGISGSAAQIVGFAETW